MRRTLLVILLALGALAMPLVPRPADAAVVDRIASYGSAPDRGSPDVAPGYRPVGITPASSGGYWVLTSDGGVHSFGAAFHGSAAGHLSSPAIGIASNPRRTGYWVASIDGGVYSFGGAPFHGSLGGQKLAASIVGIAAAPDGDGYWLVAADGGVFTFGDAPFRGSLGATGSASRVVGLLPVADGYWLVRDDGTTARFE
jgi:hypothetical protein